MIGGMPVVMIRDDPMTMAPQDNSHGQAVEDFFEGGLKATQVTVLKSDSQSPLFHFFDNIADAFGKTGGCGGDFKHEGARATPN